MIIEDDIDDCISRGVIYNALDIQIIKLLSTSTLNVVVRKIELEFSVRSTQVCPEGANDSVLYGISIRNIYAKFKGSTIQGRGTLIRFCLIFSHGSHVILDNALGHTVFSSDIDGPNSTGNTLSKSQRHLTYEIQPIRDPRRSRIVVGNCHSICAVGIPQSQKQMLSHKEQ